MSGVLPLDALTAAGVVLRASRGQVLLDGPRGALTPALLASARAARPALLLVATGAWRGEQARWPAAWRDEWAERAALREVDGHQPREMAERAAFLELRETALAPVAGRLDAAPEAFGPVTVTQRASTRPVMGEAQDEGAQDDRPARVDPRPIVHPLCCGGCGCASLTDGGRGPCSRCGYRRPAGLGGE